MNSKKAKEKILIVGAGPTGLALGLQLAHYGVSFQIIDKNKGPGTSSRAMLIVPRVLEQYQQMAFSEKVVSKSIEIEKVQFHINQKKKAEIDVLSIGEDQSPFPSLFTFPQDEHEQLLIDQLENFQHSVNWETSLVSLSDTNEGVVVCLKHKDKEYSETFSYVIGCDGASSRVRKELNIDFSGGTYEELFYVADAVLGNETIYPKHVNFFFSDEEFALFFPLRNKETTRIIGMFPTQLVKEKKTDFEHLHPFLEETFDYQLKEMNWFSTYNVHHRLANHFKLKNIFLAGDAAHIHSPVGGQGMNAGIGDALNLGWKLSAVIQKRADSSILETYELERKQFAESLVATTDRMFKVVSSKGVISKGLRKQVAPNLANFLMNKSDRVRRLFFHFISQIRIDYRSSALSEGKVGKIHAGMRLPYYKDNFEKLEEMDWQLHVYGKAEEALNEFLREKKLQLYEWEWNKAAEEKGFKQDAIYLIRPDGHIGWTNEEQDISQLERYLNEWGISSI